MNSRGQEHRWWGRALVTLALALLVGSPRETRAQVTSVPGPPAPGEAHLLERLLAPCCWLQTLDVHASPLATELRAEIHARLQAGESAEAIEDDLAGRHGERLRAVPRGRDPRSAVVWLVGLGGLASAVAVARMLRRWSRPVAVSAPPPLSEAEEARLEAELRQLDDA